VIAAEYWVPLRPVNWFQALTACHSQGQRRSFASRWADFALGFASRWADFALGYASRWADFALGSTSRWADFALGSASRWADFALVIATRPPAGLLGHG
jgi:hypothetical protein